MNITKEAIYAVPTISVMGAGEREEELITELHRKALITAMELNERYGCKEMEAGILLDLCTMDYWIINGGRGKVNLKSNHEAYTRFRTFENGRMMFIHNHPSSSTFSYIDLSNYLNADVLKIVSVVGNNGTVYMLEKNVEYKKERAIIKLNDFVECIISKIAFQKLGIGEKDMARIVQKVAKDNFLDICSDFGLCYFRFDRRSGYECG